MWDAPHNAEIPSWMAALVIVLWLLPVAAWFCRSVFCDLCGKFLAQTLGRRLVIVFALMSFTLVGADKGAAAAKIFKLLFFNPISQVWPLAEATRDTADADGAAAQAVDLSVAAQAVVESNEVWTLSFDWHAPTRLPYHERQNVLAWTAAVVPTNIAGTLYEDHYVAFNAAASTNPAVILIEYAQRTPTGVTRYSAEVVTNSYPDTSVVELQSGSYTCYWFRCAVPVAFTNSVRDWNGEALFGSPSGSGKGFDLLGTLVVDDGNDIWVGATTNHVFGAVTNEFKNGINVTEEL
jgi:hypothetical protein